MAERTLYAAVGRGELEMTTGPHGKRHSVTRANANADADADADADAEAYLQRAG